MGVHVRVEDELRRALSWDPAQRPSDVQILTSRLAEYVLTARLTDIAQDVRKEARRALVNYVGCALGGCRHDAMDITLAALGPFAGPATTPHASSGWSRLACATMAS